MYSNDIAIRTENNKSVIYAAIDANFYMGTFSSTTNVGLYRSADNGLTWTQTLPIIDSANTAKVPFAPASIQISKNNKIWVGTKASPNGNTNRGGGYILSSTNGTDWTVVKKFTVNNGYGRVSIAVAPSNANVIYAFVENNNKLENLKILCSNCHMQEHNYSNTAKLFKVKDKPNIIKEIKTCQCGLQINLRSTMCEKCWSIKNRKVERPSFDQLLNEVTEMGYSGAGRKYNVSDNTIRKWLTSFNG